MNKVILMGRLARDPDVRTTQGGRQVARMTIAVDRRISRANIQPGQQTADFINLVAWERTAEFAGHYLNKGSQILVEGRIQTRSYEAQDGSKRYVTEIIADSVEALGSRDEGSAPRPRDNGPTPPPAAPVNTPADDFIEANDDELPF